jgi:FkbM family methyltransferase
MTLVVIFARYFCWWFRFGCLRISDLVFSRSYGKHVLSRPFFGGLLSVDVSRGNPPRLLYLQGERFIEERYVVRELTPRGATVIDVGANVGHYVLMISHYGESPQIIAIEPEPSNLVELRQNLSQNSLHNVSVIEAAAAAQSGTVMLKLGLNARINGEAGDINVPAISLDSLGLGSVGFIKIDVEGFELSVLRGAVNILRDHRPNLFIEVHPMISLVQDSKYAELSKKQALL